MTTSATILALLATVGLVWNARRTGRKFAALPIGARKLNVLPAVIAIGFLIVVNAIVIYLVRAHA